MTSDPRITPFEHHSREYEAWFTAHETAWKAELAAVRALLPEDGRRLEVGVGSGRFAGPLGIRLGVEPAPAMAALARDRGIEVIDARGEQLPFGQASIDAVLMVTTICFLADVDAALAEIRRVLVPGGCVVIGFVDRESELGRAYERHKAENAFYREARFFSTEEVTEHLRRAGFADLEYRQALFQGLDVPEIEVRPGHGEGAFVVIRAQKP